MNSRARLLRRLTLRSIVFYPLVCLTILDIIKYSFLNIGPRKLPHATASNPPKLFIASTHWNNARILRNHWNSQILQISEYFGRENVFVSIYESGSWDDSRAALRELGDALQAMQVLHQIELDPVTHQDKISGVPNSLGWIEAPQGGKELRRRPYLSELRNLSLRPLVQLRANGSVFDKILFLNDVVFNVADVLTLLETNTGSYAAACGLDYSKPPKFYDTFALRDSEGSEAIFSSGGCGKIVCVDGLQEIVPSEGWCSLDFTSGRLQVQTREGWSWALIV